MCHTITGCGSQETTQKSGKKRSWLPSPVSFCSAPPLEIRVIRDCEPFRLVLLLKGNHKIWKQISLFGIIQVFFIKQYTDFIEQLKIYTRNNSFFSVFFFFNLTFFWLNNPVSIMKRALVSHSCTQLAQFQVLFPSFFFAIAEVISPLAQEANSRRFQELTPP